MSSGWAVVVEVVLLRLSAERGLAYRRVRGAAAPGADLDDRALELAGATGVCHSTSWRREGDVLVVTYAALPDGDENQAAEPLRRPSIVAGSTPLRPTPPVMHGHHIAAHAVRHLADLAERDPVIRAACADHPALWQAVVASAWSTVTGPHEQVHALAAAADSVRAQAAEPGG